MGYIWLPQGKTTTWCRNPVLFEKIKDRSIDLDLDLISRSRSNCVIVAAPGGILAKTFSILVNLFK